MIVLFLAEKKDAPGMKRDNGPGPHGRRIFSRKVQGFFGDIRGDDFRQRDFLG
jgi:Fe-S cluster biosynthesis and repair protein YggX